MSAGAAVKERQPSRSVRLIAGVLSLLFRLAHATWQGEILGIDYILQALDRKEKVLVIFWHGKYVPLFVLLQGFEACILTTRSFRGEIIAAVCRNFGYSAVEIPDHTAVGISAILEKLAAEHNCIAIAADGPRGPYHSVKAGIIHYASQMHWVIFPASIAMRRKIICRKRWDHLEIPLFFSRVCLVLGEPFREPPVLQHQDLREWTTKLKNDIEKNDLIAEKHLAATNTVYGNSSGKG